MKILSKITPTFTAKASWPKCKTFLKSFISLYSIVIAVKKAVLHVQFTHIIEQTLGRQWADNEQTMGRQWADNGQTFNRHCADFEQILGRHLADVEQA